FVPVGRSMFGFAQELSEVVVPEGGIGVGLVAVGFGGFGHDDGGAAFHAFDVGLKDVEIVGVDEVVGEVDGHEAAGDFFEVGGWVIILGGGEGVEFVVGVHRGHAVVYVFVDGGIGGLQGRCFEVSALRIFGHEPADGQIGTEGLRLGRIV